MNRYVTKSEEVFALQAIPENFDAICENFSGYKKSGGQLFSDVGNAVKEGYWVVTDGASVVIFSDTMFQKLYKQKPADKYTLAEVIAMGIEGKKLRRDWYEEGVYLKWGGFAWVMEMCGDVQLYALMPNDISDKEWIIC